MADQDDPAVALHPGLRHGVPHQRLAITQPTQLGRNRERSQQDRGPLPIDQDWPVADRCHHAVLLVDGDEAQFVDRRHVLAQAIDGLLLAIRAERRLVHRLDRGSIARPFAQQAQAAGIADRNSGMDNAGSLGHQA